MSPTLLELIVAVLLIWVAWQIGVLVAPRVLAAIASFWRNPKSIYPPESPRPEKNITPPTEHIETSPSNHHGNHPLRK